MSIKKKWIGNDQIDGSKIRLLNEQALSGNAADGSEIDILKVDADDKLQIMIPAEVAADPVGDNELARKAYVDQTAADAAASAVSGLEGRVSDLEAKHPIDLASDVQNVLPAANGGTGRTDFPATQLLFGAPDGLSIDRSEFLTYDASIGLLINQGGQMQTRTLEQNATDPSAVVIADKVEVVQNPGDGNSYTRLNSTYVEAKKSLTGKDLSASMGYDGTDSWVGVSETNIGAGTGGANLINMAKIFPNKAQLFSFDLGGSGPEPIMPVESYDLAVKGYVDQAVEAATIEIAQSVYVAADGSDATGDGSLAKPFATISGAMASITDATPTKRYAIQVAPGNYTEVSGLALKANVFVIGADMRLVRITGAVSLHSSFSGSADNRAGFSRVSLLSAVNLDWAAVTSAAGKIYCREVLFSSTLNLNGHNNAIAQAMFDQCQMFGATTISGINVGSYVDNWHWSSLALNQHPNGGMATIVNAVGCRFSGITATAAVNNFGRRCSLFLNSCFVDSLNVDGPSAYADMTNDSVPRLQATSANGGNLVYISPVSPGGINPDGNNSRYIGDFGKQWFFNFAYVHASTGTDLYLTSTAASYGPDSAGRSIFIQPDGYGLNANVNGGDIVLETAAVSGTGVRGKVDVLARVVEVNNAQIKELAAGTDAGDAVNKTQLDAKLDASEVGVSVASLVGGVVPVDQLPAIAITDTFVVANEAAMLALIAEVGDVAIREDLSKSFILAAEPPSTLANWKELLTPESAVLSVNGQTGAVTLDTDDVSEGTANLYFTEERAKQAAAAQQKHERLVLSAADITNGYIDLQDDVIGVPMVFNGPSRIPLLPTDDFSVSGARMTWNPATVGPGGEEALTEGEIIHVFYMG